MRPVLAVCAALLVLGLAACGGSDAPPESFKPLSYSYLLPLRLNVASIEIDDSWTPPPGAPDLADRSPVRPAAALRRMAEDRLVAGGSAGRAVLKIDDASIVRSGDALSGHMAVTLTIFTSDGQRSAYAEARVARTAPLQDGGSGLQTALYRITRDMADDMNVELEYQVRRSLHDWLLETPQVGGPAVPVPVSQQPLSGPGGSVPPPADSPTPLLPAAPRSLSPPPGYLQAPAGMPPAPTGSALGGSDAGTPVAPPETTDQPD